MLVTDINPFYSYQANEKCALRIKEPYIYSTKEANKIPVIVAWAGKTIFLMCKNL